MKYYNRPSWFFSDPAILKCFDEDKIPLGKVILTSIIDLIAQKFDYGSWFKNGKKTVPYGIDIMKSKLYFEIGVDTSNLSNIDYIYKVLAKLNSSEILYYEDRGQSIWVEYPDMMLYVDKTNEDTIRKHMGTSKVSAADIESLCNDNRIKYNFISLREDTSKELTNREEQRKDNDTKSLETSFAQSKAEQSKQANRILCNSDNKTISNGNDSFIEVSELTDDIPF